MDQYFRRVDISDDTRILDAGGYPSSWKDAHVIGKLTILNQQPIDVSMLHESMSYIVGDGTTLPFEDNSFDIVFSNSTIEPVGTCQTQRKFACETQRVGNQIWVQTPACDFLVEPHLLTPFIHFLPTEWQRRLLSYKEIQILFPDCAILRKRWWGMTKSYIAVFR